MRALITLFSQLSHPVCLLDLEVMHHFGPSEGFKCDKFAFMMGMQGHRGKGDKVYTVAQSLAYTANPRCFMRTDDVGDAFQGFD